MLFAPDTDSLPIPSNDSFPVRILMVDDRPENLVALEAAFQDTGYELVSALSGQEALNIMREKDFAAVLLDVQMPGMDGFETARRIRKQERSKLTPIIFVTAIHRTEEYERRGYIAGAVDYLFKPIDADILLAKVGVFADLDRKNQKIKMQAELLKQQALRDQENKLLKRAVEARDEFLSIASHELNTPITPLSLQMQAFIKMLEKGTMTDVDPERLLRMLRSSYGQIERLARIIREFVDVSRLSTGKLQVIKEKVSLAEVAASVLEEFGAEIRRQNCEVRFDVRADIVGLWDRMRIEQVIINLLTNALKYGLGKPIAVTIDRKGGRAYLEVEDQGIGLAKHDQERIFERYERAVPAQNYGGLGLGLYITREIVRLHEGRIWVESELTKGSRFVVELPVLIED